VNERASPRTTVVIPVWDRYVGFALDEALPSLRAQEVQARILLVDNASDVPLPNVEGVDLVRSSQRLSLGSARNLGLSHVHTPYVVLWDADDVMPPGTLAMLESGIESDHDLAAFATAVVETTGLRHRWPRRWVGRLMRVPALFSLLHCMWSILPTTGSTIMRTDLLRAGGGYGEDESGDDWVAGVSLVFRGRIRWSERPGRVYRVHDASVWARHMSARHQVVHAREVRDRIRADAAIPEWVRVILPLIWLGQYAAIAAHALLVAARKAGLSPRGGER
jgi:glycosyltransferase involved in cell wall biosynthesis